jgi:multicomponent K+:H+ antiporter subunit A
MNALDSVPLLILLTSLVSAAVIFLMPESWSRMRTAVNMAGATAKLVLIGVMLWAVADGHYSDFRIPLLLGADFVLRSDALASFFVTLSGVLWFLTTIYAIAYLEHSPHRRRFFGFFSLCVSATVGVAMAGNLFTFVFFYELLTLATYPLVVHRETEADRHAGHIYLAYTLLGGSLLLIGATWISTLVPGLDFNRGGAIEALGAEHDGTLKVVFWLMIAGLGVKAALVPMHSWLPAAMIAPAPVSALLHAVAVVKAGAFGVVRLLYDVYGIERAETLNLTTPLAIWASVTIVYGSLRAMYQDDLKKRLAYSTISQVSYIILGVAMVGPVSSVGGIVHLVHQGLMKITLFFCAGIFAETHGIKKVSKMNGVGRLMPLTMTAFTVAAIGMIGLPPTIGFISKWYLGIGSIESGRNWVVAVLAISSLLNAAYFLPILYVAWFRNGASEKRTGTARIEHPTNMTAATSHDLTPLRATVDGSPLASPPERKIRRETDWGLLLPPLTTAVLTVGIGLLASAPFSPLQWSVLIVQRIYALDVVDIGSNAVLSDFTAMDVMLAFMLLLPLLAACLLLVRRFRGIVFPLSAVAALPAVILAWYAEGDLSIDLYWFLLHMRLGLDEVGKHFLFFSSLLWLSAGVYSLGYLAEDRRRHAYMFWFLLTMTGNLGLIVSIDMLSFYMFFSLMSFAAYPLIIHRGDRAALRAGRVYIILVVLGETALLVAMLYWAVASDSLMLSEVAAELAIDPAFVTIIGLLLVGFGIKVGVVPLHFWLPLAHPAAPTPASAVLSGAMIKAGLLGWLRFMPLGEVSLPDFGFVWMALGIFSIFFGVVIGVVQRDAKTVLAYSSISQMGLLTLGVGGGLLMHSAWPAILSSVLVYTLHHGLSKGCLFLSVGIAPYVRGRSLSKRLLQAGLIIPAFSLAGLPLTMGAISKSVLKDSLGDLTDNWPMVLGGLFPLAAIGTTLLMARFLYLIWPNTAASHTLSSAKRNPNPVVSQKPSITMLGAWLFLLLLVIASPWLIPLGPVTERGLRLLQATIGWVNVWPMFAGIVLALIAWRLFQGNRSLKTQLVPAGDILVCFLAMRRFAMRSVIAMVFHPEHPTNFASRIGRIVFGNDSNVYEKGKEVLDSGKPGRHSQTDARDHRPDSIGTGMIALLRTAEATFASWYTVAISLIGVFGICFVLWLVNDR